MSSTKDHQIQIEIKSQKGWKIQTRTSGAEVGEELSNTRGSMKRFTLSWRWKSASENGSKYKRCVPRTIKPFPSLPLSFKGSPTPRLSSFMVQRWSWKCEIDGHDTAKRWDVNASDQEIIHYFWRHVQCDRSHVSSSHCAKDLTSVLIHLIVLYSFAPDMFNKKLEPSNRGAVIFNFLRPVTPHRLNEGA